MFYGYLEMLMSMCFKTLLWRRTKHWTFLTLTVPDQNYKAAHDKRCNNLHNIENITSDKFSCWEGQGMGNFKDDKSYESQRWEEWNKSQNAQFRLRLTIMTLVDCGLV